MLGTRDQQVTMFPNEIGFVLLGGFLTPTLALLSLARSPTSTFAASLACVLSAATPHGIEGRAR